MAVEKKEKKPKAAKSAKAADAGAEAAPTAASTAGETCRADKCKQPVRAKGYCRKHYLGWRRGKVGTKHRYNTCSREACRKPALANGVCDEHQKKKAAVEAPPAA